MNDVETTCPNCGAPQSLLPSQPFLARAIRRARWLFLLLPLVGLVVAISMQPFDPFPQYTAEATLGVSVPAEDLTPMAPTPADVVDQYKLSLALMATSDAVLQRALDNPNVRNTEWYRRNLDFLVDRLREAITVTPVPGTNLIHVSMSGPNPAELPEIVTAVAMAFEWDAKNSASQERQEQIARLEREQASYRGDVELIKRDIAALSRPENACPQQRLALLATQMQTDMSASPTLQHQAASADQALKKLQTQKEQHLVDGSPQVLAAVENDSEMRAMRRQADELAGTAGIHAQSQPATQESQGRLIVLRNRMAEREKAVRDRCLTAIEANLTEALTVAVDDLAENKAAIERASDQIRSLQRLLEELEARNARKRFLEDNIDVLERRLLDLRLLVRSIQPLYLRRPASTPTVPTSPLSQLAKMLPALAIGLAAGLIAALAAGIFWEAIRPTPRPRHPLQTPPPSPPPSLPRP